LAMLACRPLIATSRSRCSSRRRASWWVMSAGSTGSMRPAYTRRRAPAPGRRHRAGPLLRRALAAGRVVLGVVAAGLLDFPARAQEHRHPLVQLVRLDIHDPATAVAGRTAGLLDQHSHRVGLVHQPQLAAP